VNINSSLIAELRDKSYREAYVASQIRIGLPFEIRALRISRGWTQGRLAEAAGMSQPRIAEIEKGKRSLNLETLLRVASAFDIGLNVFFTSFGELVDRNESFQPDSFNVAAFGDEIASAETKAKFEATTLTPTYSYIVTGSGGAVLQQGTVLPSQGTPTLNVDAITGVIAIDRDLAHVLARNEFGNEATPSPLQEVTETGARRQLKPAA